MHFEIFCNFVRFQFVIGKTMSEIVDHCGHFGTREGCAAPPSPPPPRLQAPSPRLQACQCSYNHTIIFVCRIQSVCRGSVPLCQSPLRPRFKSLWWDSGLWRWKWRKRVWVIGRIKLLYLLFSPGVWIFHQILVKWNSRHIRPQRNTPMDLTITVNKSLTFLNFPFPISGIECKEGDIHCKNGRCVSFYLACNQKDDCGDNSDEEPCGMFLQSIHIEPLCSPPFFLLTWWC